MGRDATCIRSDDPTVSEYSPWDLQATRAIGPFLWITRQRRENRRGRIAYDAPAAVGAQFRVNATDSVLPATSCTTSVFCPRTAPKVPGVR